MTEKIVSLRSTISSAYKKPDDSTVEKQHEDLMQRYADNLTFLTSSVGLTVTNIVRYKLGYDAKKNAITIPVYKGSELVNIRYWNHTNQEKNEYKSSYGAENWIFNEEGVERAKDKGKIFIVDSEIDCISLIQRGVENVIAVQYSKDGYNPWIEMLDTIPSIYIGFQNNDVSKLTARKLVDKIGIDKCKEVSLPEDTKDFTTYLNSHTQDDFKSLTKNAQPYYNYDFVNVSSLLDSMRSEVDVITSELIPSVRIGKDWLFIISGPSNAGKTSYCMNLASDFADRNIPTLILPFERGIESVGKRFLQVRYNMAEGDFVDVPAPDWEAMKNDCTKLPVYFSRPTKEKLFETIKRSKRLFGTEIIIIDHLDYMVRGNQNKNDEMAKTLQDFKEFAMDNQVILLVVHHIKKLGTTSDDPFSGKRNPTLEDLKGSSNLYQDPECVVMLYVEKQDTLTIDIQKNKGKMTKKQVQFNKETGKIFLSDSAIKTDISKLSLAKKVEVADDLFFNTKT